MFARIAAFEIRYLLKNPLLWLTVAVVFLLPFVALAFDFQLEEDIRVAKNSAYEVVSKYRIISCLFMFATTVFVSNIVLRDDETGFAPILRSTGIGKFDYLIGRFAGAMLVVAVVLALVTPAIWLGSMMPTAASTAIGPNRIVDHLYGYFLIALPNVFLTASIFFALATVTRSMMATYVGLVVFLGCYFTLLSAFGGQADLVGAMAVLDPFSGRAFEDVVRYWTPPERNTTLPAFAGNLLYNRFVWLGVAALSLALAYRSFEFADRQVRSRRTRRLRRAEDHVDNPTAASHALATLPDPQPGPAANRALLAVRTRFEIRQVVRSPAFLILLLYTAFLCSFALITDRYPEGSPTYPLTVTLIPELQEIFFLIPLILIIIYSGELVWRERDRRMHEIIDAAPHPNWAYVVPKTFAIALVLASLFLVGVAVSIGIQLFEGFERLDTGAYVLHFLLPITWDALLLLALAVLVQVLSPHKYVGWGIMTLYVAANYTGFLPEHPLGNYAAGPPTPLSDMDGITSFWHGAWLFRIYWAAAALMLLIAAHVLWRRGTATNLRQRFRNAGGRLRGGTAWLAGGAAATFAASGAYAFYNTNILNEYVSSDAAERHAAAYERRYGRFSDVPQPSVTAMTLAIDLYPSQREAAARGTLTLSNLTDAPVTRVHVRTDDPLLDLERIMIAGAELERHDERFGYRILRFARPMAPGEERQLAFESKRKQKAIPGNAPDFAITENGTFLTAQNLVPTVGVQTQPMVVDPAVRAAFGLPPAGRAKLEDLGATGNPADERSWATADITVSTEADQTPVAPGKRVADRIIGERRVARFVTQSPIRTAFAVQSARYAVKRASDQGIDFQVYYHPAHDWNVDRMLGAMRASMRYYSENFGPYQFDVARIVEFPSYGRNYAQAFATTIPYSETRGFQMDLRKADTIDELTSMTAHELAHQYWGHQMTPAAMEGSLVLVETLAQYSTLMVMRRTLGEDQRRRQLRVQLNRYLMGRAWSEQPELPLLRAETQNVVIYNKGAHVINLVAHRLGEDVVNEALRDLLAQYRFKAAPYPRSADLLDALRARAGSPEEQRLLTDLFEHVTLYDLKTHAPTARRRPDGRWEVRVPVTARKLYADADANEREAPLSQTIEVGLFDARPTSTAFDPRHVIAMEPRTIRSGRQVLTFVVGRKPEFVGVDPYNLFIDRQIEDNFAAVKAST